MNRRSMFSIIIVKLIRLLYLGLTERDVEKFCETIGKYYNKRYYHAK